MLKSMTGYGKATATYLEKRVSVEIKSLNSKSLDLNVRYAPIYKELEGNIVSSEYIRLLESKVYFSVD